MPATTRRPIGGGSSSSSALKSRNNNVNVVTTTPNTPGKQVKKLQTELEKKHEENKNLQKNINDLTSALDSLNLVKIDTSNNDVVVDEPVIDADNDDAADKKETKQKKDKNAPAPAKTAYKFFCESTRKDEGVDMRLKWKETAPEMRQVFQTMADADKARFKREQVEYGDEKEALKMYKEKKKQEHAMEFYEAHLKAQMALEKAEADKKGGKKKKTKDPDAPKRNLSSYMYFTMDKRQSIVDANPKSSIVEITSMLGAAWSKLEKGKKGKNGTKKYDDLAAKDKIRYEEEKAAYDAMISERKAQEDMEKLEQGKQEKEEAMKLFMAAREASNANNNTANQVIEDMSVVSDITTSIKSKKKKKDPNAPKHPTSAYLFFCLENRASIKTKMPTDVTQKDLLTEVGRQWKEIPDKKKEKYSKLASNDKERYAKEMEAYNASRK
jgi:hypothetical protein